MCDGSPETSQPSPSEEFRIGTQLHLEDNFYDIKEFLGKGGFAKVYRVRHVHEDFDYAIKIVRRRHKDDPKDQKIRREVAIQRGCSNPRIVRVLFATNDPVHFFIVTELCGQTLLEYVTATRSHSQWIAESTCRHFTNDILDANIYLSNQNIIHRDIKPGNIFLTLKTVQGLEEHVKLGDFGLAVFKQDLNPQSVSGTPNYLAPEVLARQGHSEKSEVWSLACVLYCMLFGKPPFETESVQSTYERIARSMWSFPYTQRYSSTVKSLIQACLIRDHHRRPSFHQMLDHEWFSSLKHSLRSHGRTKSLFNLPDNNNSYHQPLIARPRSVLASECDDVPYSVMRRNKSLFATGSSQDSGIGSDENLCRQNRLKMESSLNFFMDVLNRYTSGSVRLAFVPSTHAIFVSKWVDYTNRSGFACQLNDGTLAVKFISTAGGGCLSWNKVSKHFLYANSPYSASRTYSKHDEELDMDINRKLRTAREYIQYMDTTLSGTGMYTQFYYCPTDQVPLLLHHQIVDNLFLIMVFSNNLIQINFFRERMKFILALNPSAESTCRMEDFRLFVISPNGAIHGFRVADVDDSESGLVENGIPNLFQYVVSVYNLLKHDCEVTPKHRRMFTPLVTAC